MLLVDGQFGDWLVDDILLLCILNLNVIFFEYYFDELGCDGLVEGDGTQPGENMTVFVSMGKYPRHRADISCAVPNEFKDVASGFRHVTGSLNFDEGLPQHAVTTSHLHR